jgi:hypothetical protein
MIYVYVLLGIEIGLAIFMYVREGRKENGAARV